MIGLEPKNVSVNMAENVSIMAVSVRFGVKNVRLRGSGVRLSRPEIGLHVK